jgi:nitrogen fixation protein FixH
MRTGVVHNQQFNKKRQIRRRAAATGASRASRKAIKDSIRKPSAPLFIVL